MLPQLYQKSKGIEAGSKKFWFSFRVHQDGSNARFHISLGQKTLIYLYLKSVEKWKIPWFFIKITIKMRKNWKIARLDGTSNLNFWMNIGRNNFGKRAFEPPWCSLIENKKIFDPASIPFDFWYNWGRAFFWFFEFFKMHPSSIVPEIKGNWGRMKFFFPFRRHQGGSNARFPKSFGQKLAEISYFEVRKKKRKLGGGLPPFY